MSSNTIINKYGTPLNRVGADTIEACIKYDHGENCPFYLAAIKFGYIKA